MMKPPFKAPDSAINVLCAPWFDMCTVWFVASLSCININTCIFKLLKTVFF